MENTGMRYRLITKINDYPHWWNQNYWTTFARFATIYSSKMKAEEVKNQQENPEEIKIEWKTK